MRTTAEAAALLDIQPQTVTRYILRGLIHAEKHGRDYQIADEELEQFLQRRRKPGNPGTKRGSKKLQRSRPTGTHVAPLPNVSDP